MKTLIAAAALAAIPSLLQAQAAPPAADDPAAGAPPPVYRSVFGAAPAGVEEGAVDWKKANAEVGQFPRGHIDLLQWEERRQPAPTAQPTPAAPRHEEHHR